MTSLRRIEANRRNASLSTGPSTEEGKTKSRQGQELQSPRHHIAEADEPTLRAQDPERHRLQDIEGSARRARREQVSTTSRVRRGRATFQADRDLPSAMEVTSVAPAATPTRAGVRIHARCRIDRILFLNDHRRPIYNDRPA